MMYKAVIFDFFGVISSEVAPFWFAQYFTAEEALKLKDEYVNPADRGDISEDELFLRLGQLVSLEPKTIREDWLNKVHIDRKVIEFIRNLKDAFPIALCSNSPSPFLREILLRNHLNELFDVEVISSEIRHKKPSAEIFLYTLEKLGCKAKEAIFIDDNIDYITAARSLGITAVHYTDISALTNTQFLKDFQNK